MTAEERLKEIYEERAAIMQFDGGMTKEQAEAAARKDVYGQHAR